MCVCVCIPGSKNRRERSSGTHNIVDDLDVDAMLRDSSMRESQDSLTSVDEHDLSAALASMQSTVSGLEKEKDGSGTTNPTVANDAQRIGTEGLASPSGASDISMSEIERMLEN